MELTKKGKDYLLNNFQAIIIKRESVHRIIEYF